MSGTKPIRRIAVIGTGVIGASWSAPFLAKGLANISRGTSCVSASHQAVLRCLPYSIRRRSISSFSTCGPREVTAESALGRFGNRAVTPQASNQIPRPRWE